MKNQKMFKSSLFLLIFLIASNLFAENHSLEAIDNIPEAKENLLEQSDITTDTDSIQFAVSDNKSIKDSTRSDTLFVIQEEDVENFVLRNIEMSKKFISKARNQGYGGSGGWTPKLGVIDMSPVKTLLESETDYDYTNIGGGFALLYMSGGMGYGGIGNGIRLGGGGWNGNVTYDSKVREIDTTLSSVNIDVSYGGFLVEKAFVKERWNLMLGGIVGGGNIRLTKDERKASGTSIFNESDEDSKTTSSVHANFFFLDLHSAFTYSLTSWMHVGADAGAAFFLSSDGFTNRVESVGTGSFMTLNPFLSIRLIWGNLG